MNKNPEIQFRSPEEIKAYQESRLAEELLYLQNHHDSTNICSKHITSIYNR